MDNLFELAARKKFRFNSDKGPLTVEQLWDLPLIAKVGPAIVPTADLNRVAQAVNAELKAVTEESFVNVKPNPLKGELETKLELVKHIIAVRIKQAEDIKAAVEKSETRRKVMDAIIAKRDAKYTDMTEDQLMKELEKLDA
jgi:hypothetical protein